MKNCVLALIVASLSVIAEGRPADGLLVGAGARASSGAYATQVGGGEAAIGNPALLGMARRSEVASDVDLLYLKYSFELPDARPAVVDVKSPLVLLSGVVNLTPGFAVGFFSMPVPAGAGETRVEGLPLRVPGGAVGVVDVEQRTLGPLDHFSGFGSSLALGKRFSMGIAAVMESDSAEVEVKDQGTDLLAFEYRRRALRYRLGAHWSIAPGFALGAFHASRNVAELSGRFKNEGGSNIAEKGVIGSEWGLGASMKVRRSRIFAESLYLRRSEDRGSIDPLSQVAGKAPLHRRDTIGAIVGFAYEAKRQRFRASYGLHPSGVGDGYTEAGEELLSGPQFGDLTALTRHVAGVGYSASIRKSFEIAFTASLTHGERVVPDTSNSVGRYSLAAAVLGARLVYRL